MPMLVFLFDFLKNHKFQLLKIFQNQRTIGFGFFEKNQNQRTWLV